MRDHLDRMITAAKNAQIKVAVQNKATPMDSEREDVGCLMKPVLEAALIGDPSLDCIIGR